MRIVSEVGSEAEASLEKEPRAAYMFPEVRVRTFATMLVTPGGSALELTWNQVYNSLYSLCGIRGG